MAKSFYLILPCIILITANVKTTDCGAISNSLGLASASAPNEFFTVMVKGNDDNLWYDVDPSEDLSGAKKPTIPKDTKPPPPPPAHSVKSGPNVKQQNPAISIESEESDEDDVSSMENGPDESRMPPHRHESYSSEEGPDDDGSSEDYHDSPKSHGPDLRFFQINTRLFSSRPEVVTIPL
ncbi:unnamed protein product [Allacma fusca]|uniref:Uncharacterized protein n=1 Tax=Allacma fusca TaxID=39272 RepID=A0A8J2LCQ4_9HEXA|nr:unnamed protein product [Allacma fusca]